MDRLDYPRAPKVDLVETIHGVEISDPFRRLEDASDPDTVRWVDAENALTRRLLDGPDRDRLVEELQRLHRCPRAFLPAARRSRLFFLSHDGEANQPSLCFVDFPEGHAARSANQAMRALIDPNTLATDGTTALTAFEPDEAGRR